MRAFIMCLGAVALVSSSACDCGGPPANGDDGGVVPKGEGEGEGEGEPSKICLAECVSASDCVLDNAPAHIDDDNYACTAGICEYLGCLAEAECDAIGVSADDFTCYQQASVDISLCLQQCDVAADCVASASIGAFDEDNYACNSNACEYMGCHDDEECTASLGDDGRCVPGFGGKSYCAAACTAPEDCVSDGATAPYDDDNFLCEDGACRYEGCNDDEECAEALAGYVCR